MRKEGIVIPYGYYKTPDRGNLREERVILAHSLRAQSIMVEKAKWEEQLFLICDSLSVKHLVT